MLISICQSMWGPEVGGVLLVSPHDRVVDWILMGVGMLVGMFVTVDCSYIQYAFVGAVLYCGSRDFGIPLDAMILAGVPVCLVSWKHRPATGFFVLVGFVVNYFFAESIDVPRNSWTPAVFAAIYVAGGQWWNKWSRVGLVIARHLVPRAVHVYYGMALYTLAPMEIPYYDSVSGPALLIVIFALLAQEDWFHYVLAGISLAALAPAVYIRARSRMAA